MLNSFVDASLRDIGSSAAVVWLVLFRDTRNGLARTAQQDIARRTGLTARTVYSALKRLQGCGLVRVVRRGGLNRGPSVYRLRGVSDAS